MVATLLSFDLREIAFLMFICFIGYLRPREAYMARCVDLVRPAGSRNQCLRSWGLIIAPQERPSEPSKTREFDDTVLFDYPEWVGQLFARRPPPVDPECRLFNVDPRKVKIAWSRAREALHLPKQFCMYQLRHGGASEDALSRRRSLAEIMQRGRWKAMNSLKRYTKPGQVQKMLNDLSPGVRQYAAWATTNLRALLFGDLRSQPPP